MTREEVVLKQQEVIRNVLDDDTIILNDDTSANDIDEWDSFTHLQIIMEIENTFKVKFALGELQAIQNVGEMTSLILEKI